MSPLLGLMWTLVCTRRVSPASALGAFVKGPVVKPRTYRQGDGVKGRRNSALTGRRSGPSRISTTRRSSDSHRPAERGQPSSAMAKALARAN